MKIEKQVEAYIASLPGKKSADIQVLHQRMLQLYPGAKLWFLDGKNDEGKIVSNPSIGYGFQKLQYADGSTKAFYQIGISANSTGISVYIMGLDNKKYLAETYAGKIGKATVTAYCIHFKTLNDIAMEVLEAAVMDGIQQTANK